MIDESPFAKHVNGTSSSAPVEGAPVDAAAETTTSEQGPCVHCRCVALDHPASNTGSLDAGVPFCACGKCPGYVDSHAPHTPTEAEGADLGRPEEPIDPSVNPEADAVDEAGLLEESERALDDEQRSLPPHWICTNCGTTNDAAPADAIVEKCSKCSEPSEAQKARIAAGLGTIGGGVGTAAEVEETARKMEGVAPPPRQPLPPPRDRTLPYRGTTKAGRFDAFDALDALKESRDRVVYCQSDHDADVKRAKASGQRLKEAETEYFELFDSIYERKEKADIQPELGLEQEDPYVASDCQVERSTGAPCPACQSQRAKGKPADPSEPLHPAHPQHEEVAKALLIKDMNELLARLQKKNFYLDIAELTLLPVGDLQVLQRYGAQRGRIPSTEAGVLIMKAHLAAVPGTDRQECKRCGVALIDRKDLDAGSTFYPDNVNVGLDCEGPDKSATVGEKLAKTDPPAAPPPPVVDEATAPRKPKSHAKKNAKTRVDPEQERKHQASEGRRKTDKAVTKKAPAKKTGKKK